MCLIAAEQEYDLIITELQKYTITTLQNYRIMNDDVCQILHYFRIWYKIHPLCLIFPQKC